EIERHEERSVELLGQGLDMRLRLFVEIGDGEIGAESVKSLGTPIGDRLIIGDAGDERFFALEQGQAGNVDHSGFSLSVFAPCARSTRSVCRAIISSSSVGMT